MGALLARDGWRLPGRQMPGESRSGEAATHDRSVVFEYALSLAFLLPLLFGVFSAVKSQRMSVETDGLAHDLVHMYKQGVDFSTPANRSVALELARARGLALGGSSGMAILSRIHVVTEGDGCYHCLNAGRAVFDQQVVIGSGALGRSQAGTPPSDAASGLVANAPDNAAARADLPEDEMKPGAPAWICELWFPSAGEPGGIYVRVTD